MKYRKKPIIVEAEQWFPGRQVDGVNVDYRNEEATIVTREGLMLVSPGDWVITGIQGEKYPCKPDIFAVTYEPVE